MTPGFHHYVAVLVAVSAKSVSVPAVRMPLLLGACTRQERSRPRRQAAEFPAQISGRSSRHVRTAGTENRTRSYMNGSTATANLRKRRTLFVYVSYGVLTEFLRMNVILTYFATETATATDTERWTPSVSQCHTSRRFGDFPSRCSPVHCNARRSALTMSTDLVKYKKRLSSIVIHVWRQCFGCLHRGVDFVTIFCARKIRDRDEQKLQIARVFKNA